ncbi:platelet endothelial cell adhesion molecule isoform X1 [Danio rerio]|uniref:Platelet endothelial cell adhesion molecule isoform X1 n=1 Tax=Danio rerio TaxID=7955 RepID=A0ACD6B6F6_DANRE|nr:unnamed protein product [Danio rerio]
MRAGLLWLGLAGLWQALGTRAAITIDQVRLTVHPGNEVVSGTNLILRCEADVSHSLSRPPTHSFSFLHNGQVVYSKNISASVVERTFSPARVSNSGQYECTVRIEDKAKTSNRQTLRITGLQTPTMKVKSDIVSEGEDIIATCSAAEETGTLMFLFYEDNQEVKSEVSNTNTISITLTMKKLTDIYLHCAYMVVRHPTAGFSNNSNTVKVFVRDLKELIPQISFSPSASVVEGERVAIKCEVQDRSALEMFLTKDGTILQRFHTSFTYSLTVREEDSGDYVCKTEKGSVQKKVENRLSVTALFTRPILTMSPYEVFEGEFFKLNCSSSVISNKISKEDIKYVLLKDGQRISTNPIFRKSASLVNNGKYSCWAMARGVNKTSLPHLLKAKVPVSVPVLSAVGKVIVGRPFKVLCEAKNGTLPITYTLLKDHTPVDSRVVNGTERAIFTITSIRFPGEIDSFTCQAYNGPRFIRTSDALTAPVIVPVSEPMLKPQETTVTEGSDLVLICSVQEGSYPITFTWYHDKLLLLYSRQEVQSSKGSHVVKMITRDQRGDYHCEASNQALETKQSKPARIGVSLALWKKALIGVLCILLLVAIVVVLTVFFKKTSHPRRKRQATELSVKPSRPKSGDPMRMSLTLDIEDNTVLNGTPCVMGRNVWSENASGSDSDDHTDEESELVQPEQADPSREIPMPKNAEDEYIIQHTEVQVSTPGVPEQAEGQAALEYVQLNNSEQETHDT